MRNIIQLAADNENKNNTANCIDGSFMVTLTAAHNISATKIIMPNSSLTGFNTLGLTEKARTFFLGNFTDYYLFLTNH